MMNISTIFPLPCFERSERIAKPRTQVVTLLLYPRLLYCVEWLIWLLFLISSHVFGEAVSSKRILICGVGKNVGFAAKKTIKNIENLGSKFSAFKAIIYENNSDDETVEQYTQWACDSDHVIFISESLPSTTLSLMSRTEKIARARNIVLDIARDYSDYDYLLMVDLDFTCDWPIDAIVDTVEISTEWDCVSANGLANEKYSQNNQDIYWDRYALRNKRCPLGPEVLGDLWWRKYGAIDLNLSKETELIPVYSAFGGLAIYKTAAILRCVYSGTVTEDLETFYHEILTSMDKNHPQLKDYLRINRINSRFLKKETIPLIFRSNTAVGCPEGYIPVTCCEHLPLHASMHRHGEGKFFINLKMVMRY